MLFLLGRTAPNFQGVEKLYPRGKVPHNDPFSLLQRPENHTYWTIGMQFSDPILQCILDSGNCRATYDEAVMIVSGSVSEWHAVIRHLLDDERKSMRQFATVVVQTFPDLFRTFSRSMNPDGTIALRK